MDLSWIDFLLLVAKVFLKGNVGGKGIENILEKDRENKGKV